MTTSELRQEVQDALKSVQYLPTTDTVEVETDTILDIIQKHVDGQRKHVDIPLTREELQIAWNAMEYAFEGFDSDMSLSEEEQQDIHKLESLKNTFKRLVDDFPVG